MLKVSWDSLGTRCYAFGLGESLRNGRESKRLGHVRQKGNASAYQQGQIVHCECLYLMLSVRWSVLSVLVKAQNPALIVVPHLTGFNARRQCTVL